jgi:arylsulfatase A-like enzyme
MIGRPFLGNDFPERKYVFAARDRMDETFDRIRTVRDSRYRYIRNYYPELPYAQHILYMDEMKTMQAWRKAFAEGKLNEVQKLFFAEKKPKEELYDTEADPYEIKNLVDDPRYAKKLQELRDRLDQWEKETKDLGSIPETELIKQKLVVDKISTEYAERIRQHPAGSKAHYLPRELIPKKPE